jgi:hypothetical protein
MIAIIAGRIKNTFNWLSCKTVPYKRVLDNEEGRVLPYVSVLLTLSALWCSISSILVAITLIQRKLCVYVLSTGLSFNK